MMSAIMLPTFFIAGAAKAGSSTLYKYLATHPDIFMAKDKEPAFFTKHYHKGDRWYESLFASAQISQAIGEATVEYMVDHDAPLRIQKRLPMAKFIFILRNPSDRAWSHYWHRVKNGEETRSAEQIFSQPDLSHEYVVRYGMYHEHLQRYFDLFDKKQIKILILEKAKINFTATLDDLFGFIGVEPEKFSPEIEPQNKSAMHRLKWIAIAFARIRAMDKLKDGLPVFLYHPLRKIFQFLNSLNKKDWQYPPLPEDFRIRLNSIFRDDVKKMDEFYPGISRIWDI